MPAIDRERWRELEPYLNEALELSGDEREAWIALLRERSSETADEIVALLSQDEALDDRDPLFGAATTVLRPHATATQIGPYRLVRTLGRGGMGTVWLASRSDGRFEGDVAIKLLSQSLLTPHGQERFRREGSMLARLRHPGVAQLLDAGVTGEGQPYLVLEHIDGERIDAFVSARDLSVEARVRIVLQVMDAVAHAHANLIVHRDIKPSNILVTRAGVVKLLDFGIAKLLDTSASDPGTALTVDGGRVLTPEYAAPEQLHGDTVTTATDVYAIGVLLYLLLSGQHPTLSEPRLSAAIEPGRFDRLPRRLGLDDLDTILQKSLKVHPEERYQTIAGMADDLKRYLRQEPVSARPDTLAYRARRFVRRNRAAVTAATFVAVSLVAATTFSALQMREAQRQRDSALAERARADAQVEFQGLLMSAIGDRPMSLRELLDASRRMLESTYVGDDRTLVDLLLQLSISYAGLGEVRQREQLVARAESLATRSGNQSQLAQVQCQLGDLARLDGDMAAARLRMDRSASLLSRAPDDGAEVRCLDLRAQLELEAGDADAAESAARRAVALLDRHGQARGHQYAQLLATIAQAQTVRGDVRPGVRTYERALQLLDSTGWGGTLTGEAIRHNAALAIGKLGETAHAERLMRAMFVRVLQSDSTGRVHVQLLVHLGHLALVQRLDSAAGNYFALLERRAIDDDSPYWQVRATFGLAQAQMRLGDLTAAGRTMQRFDAARRRVDRVGTDDQIVYRQVLDGEMALRTGRPDSALVLLRSALTESGYPARQSRRQHMALMLAARAALLAGAPDDARDLARNAEGAVTVDSVSITRSTFVGEARLLQAQALLALDDSSAARATLAAAATALTAGAGADHPVTREAIAVALRLGR